MDTAPERNLLDKLHLRPAIRWWALEQQGQLLACAHRTTQPDCDIGGKRGVIRGFTRAARLRMLKWIARIDWQAAGTCLWITLTHPDGYWPESPSARTQQRNQFLRDMERQAGRKMPALWRCEWKPRQSGACEGQLAPHLHMIVFSRAWIDAPWLSKRWAGILGYPGHVQTDIDLLEGAECAAQYAAKYCGKVVLSGLDNDAYPNISWGRCWGFHRKHEIPFAVLSERPVITPRVADVAKDMAAEARGQRIPGGFCLLNRDAKRLYDRLIEISDLYS